MAENQELANEIGSVLRSAERAVQGNDTGQAIVELGTLHGLLGKAFIAYNAVADEAGIDPLDWDQVAGNTGAARGEFHTDSGGTPKGAPSAS